MIRLFIFLIFIYTFTFTNPYIAIPPSGKSIPMIFEDLKINVHEKYSLLKGKFRFENKYKLLNRYVIKIPILKQNNLEFEPDYYDVNVKCGEEPLRLHNIGSDKTIDNIISVFEDKITAFILEFKFKESCDSNDFVTISYKQENFKLFEDDAVTMYIPLINKTKKRSENYSIKLINHVESEFKILYPKSNYFKRIGRDLKIHPLDKEVIIVSYGSASKYNLFILSFKELDTLGI